MPKNQNKEDSDQKEKQLKKAAPAAPVKPKSKSEDWTIRRIEKDASLYSDSLSAAVLAHLAQLDLLSSDSLSLIEEDMDLRGLRIVESILQRKLMTEGQVGQAVADFFNTTYVSFKGSDVPKELLTIIPKDVIRKSGVVAFQQTPDTLKVAMVNPTDLHFIHLLEKKVGKRVEVHFTTVGQIDELLRGYFGEFEDRFEHLLVRASENISHLEALDSISEVFDSLVLMAFQRKASDVHIEPLNDEIRVRFRIDGVLHSITSLPSSFLETIINHIKVLAKLRIDTHHASQDGRFHINYEKTTINFRVSIVPTHYGEKAVLRLLTSETQKYSLHELGYERDDEALIAKNIQKTNGMILVCGPTGSGKSTTLYSILKELNQEGVNISTIEDPIEYGLPGIMQIQVNPGTNITFAEGLKSLMRQDPDILMVGEIRDHETGQISVNSALTGHLIFSTLHTNNASLAPLRLLQMGVDPYLVVTTTQMIVAQRLVRKNCQDCIGTYTITADEVKEIAQNYALSMDQMEVLSKELLNGAQKSLRLYKGSGCKRCGNTGFHGRTVIAEVLIMQDNIRELILNNAKESEIEAASRDNGMKTMLEDGLRKVLSGKTTLEEVMRVINQ